MVEGRETKITVIDLDGTLVRGNTLHIYILSALRESLRCHRWGFVTRCLGVLLLRRMRLVSHVSMKRKILPRIDVTDALRQRFVREVDRRRRVSVMSIAEASRTAGDTVVLATAAPEVYVPWIWDGEFVASPNDSTWECRGLAKVAALRATYKDFDARLRMIVTDHEDDLPLLMLPAPEKLLISPTPRTSMIVKMAIPNIMISE